MTSGENETVPPQPVRIIRVNLQDFLVQQVSDRCQAYRGTWEALKWLRENRDRFEKDVLGPVCLELSVKDRDSARLIETALAKKKLLGFIVQSDKDYDTFMKEATKHGSTLKACTCSRMLQSDTNQELKEDLRAARGKLDEYGIDGTLKSR